MLYLISPAKTFAKVKKGAKSAGNPPLFAPQTSAIANQLISYSPEELGHRLHLSPKLAEEAYSRWHQFGSTNTPRLPALQSYSGMVFKKIDVASLSPSEWAEAEAHLLITSFVYGLLRPLDQIAPYRLEGAMSLGLGEAGADVRIFDYWRDVLTPYLIKRGKEAGGTLIFLASEEMKQLFHWAQVEQSLRVITPVFVTEQIDGSRKQIVIYTKMARGGMTRALLHRPPLVAEELQHLSPEGFVFAPELSSDNEWIYVLPCQ